jgi:hypothetical protein
MDLPSFQAIFSALMNAKISIRRHIEAVDNGAKPLVRPVSLV